MSESAEPSGGPIDPDVDLHFAAQRAEYSARHPAILAVIAAGGVVGALLRFQVGRWWPTPSATFPAATLTINLTGCLAIGVVLGVIMQLRAPHPLARPFLATGILGGYTTFSTYAVDLQSLLRSAQYDTALAYLAITAIGAIVAVGLGLVITRSVGRRVGDRPGERSGT